MFKHAKEDGDDQPFFIQTYGSLLTKPSPELNKIGVRCGYDGTISTRAIRKTMATMIRDHLTNDQRSHVATYMNHSLKTADLNYAARWKREQNVQARN